MKNGLLMTKDKTNILFVSSKKLGTGNVFKIPEGVKKINTNLSGYTNIENLIIPESFEDIEAKNLPIYLKNIEVNENNKSLTVENECLYTKDKKTLIVCFDQDETVELSNVLENICDYAFRLARNLKVINLPDSVFSIGGQAFSSNSNLETLTIGKNANKINPIFKYQNYSGKVIIDSQNPNYVIEDNLLFNKDKTDLISVLKEINGVFIVPSTVTKIGDSAFHNQNKMTEVELPQGLKSIGNSFNYCSNLVEINIPNTVELIGNNCFSNSANLDKIKIDNSKDKIQGAPWGAVKGNRIIEWLK